MPLIYLDDAGIHAARLDDLKAYLESGFKGIFGFAIDLSTETADGQVIGIFSEIMSDAYQATVQTYAARSPASATGAALARLVKINGVTKKDPQPSTGSVTLTGTIGAVIAAGLRIGNVRPGVAATFITIADATIGGGGSVSASIQSTVNGPIPGNAGDLTVILTPVPNLVSVTNAADVILGNTGETDGQLRTRRTASVALPSQGIVDGLRATILQIDGVDQCVVRENPEDTTQTLADGGTLVAHAIQVIVKSGAPDQDIADVMWLKKSSGVTLVGSTVVPVNDSQLVPHSMKFDHASLTPIYVKVTSASALSSDVKTKVQNAIAARGNGLLTLNGAPLPGSQIGETVSVSDVYQAIAVLSVTSCPGLKVGEIDISTAPVPTTDADLTIFFDHIATWDSSNVTFSP